MLYPNLKHGYLPMERQIMPHTAIASGLNFYSRQGSPAS